MDNSSQFLLNVAGYDPFIPSNLLLDANRRASEARQTFTDETNQIYCPFSAAAQQEKADIQHASAASIKTHTRDYNQQPRNLSKHCSNRLKEILEERDGQRGARDAYGCFYPSSSGSAVVKDHVNRYQLQQQSPISHFHYAESDLATTKKMPPLSLGIVGDGRNVAYQPLLSNNVLLNHIPNYETFDGEITIEKNLQMTIKLDVLNQIVAHVTNLNSSKYAPYLKHKLSHTLVQLKTSSQQLDDDILSTENSQLKLQIEKHYPDLMHIFQYWTAGFKPRNSEVKQTRQTEFKSQHSAMAPTDPRESRVRSYNIDDRPVLSAWGPVVQHMVERHAARDYAKAANLPISDTLYLVWNMVTSVLDE